MNHSYMTYTMPDSPIITTHTKKLIKVCAWCAKTDYPLLKKNEEYTHGICGKHYRKITNDVNLAHSFVAQGILHTTITTIDELTETFYRYTIKYLRLILSSVRF